MKTKLSLLITMLLSITIFAQDLTVTFENATISSDGVDEFYEADIVVASTEGFKLGDGLIYFNYNTAAFGENVVANGNFEFLIPDDAILALPGGFGLFYSTNFVDNTNNVVSTNYSAGGSAGAINGNNITSTPTILFSIKIKYEDVAEDPGISFNTSINGATEQFFTACGPFDTAAAKDCVNFPGTQITSDNATFDSTGAEIEPLSITDLDNDNLSGIRIFPNPVVDNISIAGDVANVTDAKIYAINGLVVKDITSKLNNASVQVADLSSGVYFLQLLTSAGSKKTIKLIKQ